MLTIKQITENTEAVLRGLEKKHFKNAKETIDEVIALNDKRRTTQNLLDKNLAEVNSLSRTIGQLMKEGKKEEAEAARARVAELKESNKALDATMTQAATDMQNVLYTIPNIPYDSVPEGVGAEDNVVEKMGGMETELPKDALPHWELAKKYDLIDFDLGVKITGAGFPVYKGKGAQLQRALINFFLDEARKSGYTEIMPPTVVNAASGYGTGQLPDKEGQMYHCEVDDLYLIPTAEVPVTNIYRDVILEEKQLPIMNCAATIEPLCEHLEHYQIRLQNLFGAGVQACFRGPRLYDTEDTRKMVSHWVAFYKKYRRILDSDIVHLRRPDGRDWDGILHVNPDIQQKGFLAVYNPLLTDIERTIRVPLYYTGLHDKVRVKEQDGKARTYTVDRDYSISLKIRIPAKGFNWYIFE